MESPGSTYPAVMHRASPPRKLTFLSCRLKNFCGSIADSVVSKSNVLHIRFFAEAAAINSTFSILFTAFREKAAGESEFFFCAENFSSVVL